MSKVEGNRQPKPKTGGRQKGVPNKTTAALKDAILNAFTKVGGEEYLVTVARSDPRTFCALIGKVLPLQVTGTGEDGAIRFVVSTGVPR